MLFLQLLANGIFIGSIYALLGLSFATIFASTKIWHFAHGAVYTIGGYALLVLAGTAHLPFGVAVLVAALFCAALGALPCLASTCRFRRAARRRWSWSWHLLAS